MFSDGFSKIIKAIKSLKWYETVMCLIMVGISIYYAINPTDDCPQWLAFINLISGLCGVMCIFLTAKANRMNFPFAIINTCVFIIYLFYFGIWATFWLELAVYLPINIISWCNWAKHKDQDDDLLAKSKEMNIWQNAMVFGAIVGLTVFVHYSLTEVAGNSWMRFAENYGWNIAVMQWLDAVVFSLGIAASILQMFRYKEQYVWWIITDVVAVAQYFIKKDPVYTTKKAIYLIEAFIGYKNWYDLAKKNKRNE